MLHKRITLFSAALALILGGVFIGSQIGVTRAQDDMGIACDSTLATLLLVAEHDYDYLSGMMDNPDMTMPTLDLGQFQPLIDSIVAMMTESQAEMTEDEAMMMDAMNTQVTALMEMDSAGIIAAYEASMGMEMMSDMTVLQPGNVADENETCSTLRAGLERFIVAHIVAESMAMMESEG